MNKPGKMTSAAARVFRTEGAGEEELIALMLCLPNLPHKEEVLAHSTYKTEICKCLSSPPNA